MKLLMLGWFCACMLGAQPKPDVSSIEGHVLNSVTGAPVRKAMVTLGARNVNLTDETDAEGRFHFTALPPGTYTLRAKRPGFLDHAARRPVTLVSNGDVDGIEIRLPPQGVISGRVVDEDNDPVGGASVSVFKSVYRDGRRMWVAKAGAITDEAGEYRVPNLRQGRYLAMANVQQQPVNNKYLPGSAQQTPEMNYVPAYYPNAGSEQTASPVEVGAGAQVRDIDIHLFKAAKPMVVHVRGKVTGVGKDSQSIVFVWLEQADRSAFVWQGAAGLPDYLFEAQVPPGQYRIFAVAPSGAPEVFAAGSLTVTGDVTGVELALASLPEIPARISLIGGDSQRSLTGIRVIMLRHPTYNWVPQGLSDDSGKTSLTKVLPGHYAIEVSQLPDGYIVDQVRLAGQEISSEDVEISGSGQMEILLSKTAGTITGSVLDRDGKAVPDSTVTLFSVDAKSRAIEHMADDNGNFKFTNLSPGKYQLFAWEEVDDDEWQDPELRRKLESRGTEIAVGPSETKNAQPRLITVEEMK